MTRLRHYDHADTARFVTFSIYRRLQVLTEVRLAELFLAKLESLRQKYSIRILGYVVMPDYVHPVLLPPTGHSLGRSIGELKSRRARRFFSQEPPDKSKTRVLWQRRCYDHNWRDTPSVIEKMNYCHNNPVRKGLVNEPGEWKWSSVHWYQGKGDQYLTIEGIEL